MIGTYNCLAPQLVCDPVFGIADLEGRFRSLVSRASGWPSLERLHLSKEGFCRVCGTTKNLQVHHRFPVHRWPEMELDPSNLMTLCAPHHLLAGHLCSWASWNENVVRDANRWLVKIRSRPSG